VHGQFGTVGDWQAGNRARVLKWLGEHREEAASVLDALLTKSGLTESREELLDNVTRTLVARISGLIEDDPPDRDLSQQLAEHGMLPDVRLPDAGAFISTTRVP